MSTETYPNSVEVRAWAQAKRAGASLSNRGPLPHYVIVAWNRAHPDRPYIKAQGHHGTPEGYGKYGCRCDDCLAAGRAYDHARRSLKNEELADGLLDA